MWASKGNSEHLNQWVKRQDCRETHNKPSRRREVCIFGLVSVPDHFYSLLSWKPRVNRTTSVFLIGFYPFWKVPFEGTHTVQAERKIQPVIARILPIKRDASDKSAGMSLDIRFQGLCVVCQCLLSSRVKTEHSKNTFEARIFGPSGNISHSASMVTNFTFYSRSLEYTDS